MLVHCQKPEASALPHDDEKSPYDSDNESTANSDDYTPYADCPSCNAAKQLQRNNIWFHITSCNRGVAEAPVEKYYPFSASGVGKLSNTVPAQDNFFTPNNSRDSLGDDNKPKGPVVWWSRGEWAFDPYHEQKCDEHSESLVSGVNGIAIENPMHILRVRHYTIILLDNYNCQAI